jgi:rod shape-determining protein MreC
MRKEYVTVNSFFKKKIVILTLAATFVLVTLMIVSTAVRNSADIVTDGTGAVVSATSGVLTRSKAAVSGFIENIINARELAAQLEGARAEIARLEKKTREITALENENERLRRLLDFKEKNSGFKSVAAEITAKNPGNWYSEFIIDKGSDDGIEKYSAVITDEGLVGYVGEVGKTWARVMTVIDPSTSVGCIVERSGDMAITEGDLEIMNEGACRVSYIAKDAGIVVGDYVETSGIGSMYPKGILIGRIIEIKPDLQGIYHVATLEAAVRFDRLREVLVITG